MGLGGSEQRLHLLGCHLQARPPGFLLPTPASSLTPPPLGEPGPVPRGCNTSEVIRFVPIRQPPESLGEGVHPALTFLNCVTHLSTGLLVRIGPTAGSS